MINSRAVLPFDPPSVFQAPEVRAYPTVRPCTAGIRGLRGPDSNRRPPGYEPVTLPAAPPRQSPEEERTSGRLTTGVFPGGIPVCLSNTRVSDRGILEPRACTR